MIGAPLPLVRGWAKVAHRDHCEGFKPLETNTLTTIAVFMHPREGGTPPTVVTPTHPTTLADPLTHASQSTGWHEGDDDGEQDPVRTLCEGGHASCARRGLSCTAYRDGPAAERPPGDRTDREGYRR